MNTRSPRSRHASRPAILVLTVVAAIALAACGTGPDGPGPSDASPGSSASASSGASPAASPCEVHAADGKLVSDRLVGLDVSSGPTADVVVFRFGPDSGLGLDPSGRMREVYPPFVGGASGEPLEVRGDRFVELAFEGLFLYDADGTPSFVGEYRVEPSFAALRAVVNAEEFEGHSTWIIGFTGAGCVDLDLSGPSLTLSIGH